MKTLVVIVSAAFGLMFLPNHALACEGNATINPVASVDCQCSGFRWSDGSCGGPKITPYGSYNTCTNVDSGATYCITDPQFCYYDSTPCVASYDFWGIVACALDVAGTGLAGATAVAACLVPVVDLATCGPAVGLYLVGLGSIPVQCRYCATHDCSAPSSGVTHNYVTPSHAGSGTCPTPA